MNCIPTKQKQLTQYENGNKNVSNSTEKYQILDFSLFEEVTDYL